MTKQTAEQTRQELSEALAIKVERDRLIEQNRINEELAKERIISNNSYARKEFEKAIIWFVVVLVGAILLAIVNGIVK